MSSPHDARTCHDRGDSLGALVDLASDTNYIVHQAVERLDLTDLPYRVWFWHDEGES